MTSLRRLGALVWCFFCAQMVAQVPSIDAANLGTARLIRQVRFEVAATPEMRGPEPNSLVESYAPGTALLTAAELESFGSLGELSGTGKEISVRRGDDFDLWSQFGSVAADPTRHAARLSFEVVGAKGDSAYLLIGNDDCSVVFVDGRAVWGVVGVREQVEAENVVCIPLHGGAAKVDVLSWKHRTWTRLPRDQFLDAWSVNLTLCGTAAEAWEVAMGKAFHFLETPVVRDPADFRVKVLLAGHDEVAFHDLEGSVVARSRILQSGRLAPPAPALPERGFVGLAVLADRLAEAIVVTGDRPIDEFAEEVLQRPNRQISAPGAWEHRCRHLFKPEFRGERHVWWARKATVSIAHVGLRSAIDRSRSPFHLWRSSLLEFGEYVSKIDGSTQYYRAYVGSGETAVPRPLVVMFRGVNTPNRPFLESVAIAELRASELQAWAAQETGCDLLWPGEADVDYGGDLTQAWVQEGVSAFLQQHKGPPRPVMVVGFCSGAVSAIRYAETHAIDGLVLWTSVVRRPNYRWPVTTPGNWPLLPSSVMSSEDSTRNRSALRRVPVFALFDHDEPGHGDWPGTAALCEELRSLGGSVDEEWVEKPDNRIVWGLRATVSELRWMRWVVSQAVRSAPQKSLRVRQSKSDTVKSALLNGFVLEPAVGPAAEAWVRKWGETLASYRGAPPLRGSMPAGATRVVARTLDGETFLRELTRGFGVGAPQMPATASLVEAAAGYSMLFGIRLELANPDRVEVWCDARGGAGGQPPVDLFCEGCCQAALWGLRNGRWEVIQVWL